MPELQLTASFNHTNYDCLPITYSTILSAINTKLLINQLPAIAIVIGSPMQTASERQVQHPYTSGTKCQGWRKLVNSGELISQQEKSQSLKNKSFGGLLTFGPLMLKVPHTVKVLSMSV